MNKLITLCILGLSSLALSGCGEDKTTTLQDNIDSSHFAARFDPSNSILPFPNNLLFTGSTDGTLNIPAADPDDYMDPTVALNALDGFSTLAPISATFTDSIDAASLSVGSSVRVFEVELSAQGALTAVTRELSAAEYAVTLSSVDTSGSTLVILPLTPLDAASSYLVVLTNGIKSTDGKAVKPDTTYALTKSTSALIDGEGHSQYAALTDQQAQDLEPLRQLTNLAEGTIAAVTAGLETADIVLSWTFTTQSIGAVLTELEATATAGAIATAAIPAGEGNLTTADVLGAGPGLADVHAGTLTLPYYLTAPSEGNPTASLTQFWHGAEGSLLSKYNTTAVATGNVTVPVLMTVPNTGTMPANGWPVVIFQHGITGDRSNLFGIADTLAANGYVAVAIDLPLHGITDTGNGLYAGALERHFGVDFINNTTFAEGPDGVIDDSGQHFINLKYLLTSRDNLRQAVADLFVLYQSLGNIPSTSVDTDKVYFLGHSLGGIVGATFLALEPGVKDAVLAMPGGGIAKLLDGSARFGPVVAGGLAAAGVVKGTADYESFMGAAQTVLDTADPINHAANIANGRGVLLFEVVGGGGSLPDQVVPNNVFAAAPAGTVPSPTAGTDPLATAMGLTRYDSSTAGTDLAAWVRFTAGDHSSILDPSADAATTTEMQTETTLFLNSGGNQLTVVNPAVVEAQD